MAASSDTSSLRFLFALPGFHSEERGAEIALLAVADELAKADHSVTVIGSGPSRSGPTYAYRQVKTVNRRRLERLPRIPPFRSETVWEDASFAWGLRNAYDPAEFDVTVTCNFPFTHWALRRGKTDRPKHLFVTQNGHWPAVSDKGEFRFFDCDGLVCINPDYQNDCKERWNTALIPNGIHQSTYDRAVSQREKFGLPADSKVVLMVSALIGTKRVADGIRAVAPLNDVHLVVAGDGPLRGSVDALAAQLLPGRFKRLTVRGDEMPDLYASADTFLHMSLTESFGNVYVEAMASGLPIVANDTSRVRWIVGARDTLCDAQDLHGVTEALDRALSTGRGAADARARDFAWPRIAERYAEFARTVAAS